MSMTLQVFASFYCSSPAPQTDKDQLSQVPSPSTLYEAGDYQGTEEIRISRWGV